MRRLIELRRLMELGILPGRYTIVRETNIYVFVKSGNSIFVIAKEAWNEYMAL